jgi:hypothetical protein
MSEAVTMRSSRVGLVAPAALFLVLPVGLFKRAFTFAVTAH